MLTVRNFGFQVIFITVFDVCRGMNHLDNLNAMFL
ncbi:Uncharacterised protein [Vibrio cholerae]|nr:Uncharacterised protein [Vibrio cholerae]